MAGGVALAIFAFAGYLAIRSYLHSEKFRALVGDETSKALDAEGEFEAFNWQGKSMYSKSFAARGTEDALFSRMKAHEVRAKVSLAGVNRGVWEVPSVHIDRFDFVVSDERPVAEEDDVSSAAPDEDVIGSSTGGGMFSGWIPSEVEIQEVAIKNVNFNVETAGQSAQARGIKVTMQPTSAEAGYSIAGESGTLKAVGFPKFAIDDFNLRTGEGAVYLDHAAMRFHKSGKVQMSGDAQLGDTPKLHFNGVMGGLDLAEVLSTDWVKKFKGIVNGKFKLKSDPAGALVTSGTLNLRNGSLEAMPVLRRIDTLAGTTRFRKLNFTNVEVEFEQRSDELELGEVLFESSGLGCLKGRMVRSASGTPDGMYMLGVSPDTIKFIPIGRKQVVEQVFQLDRDTAFAAVFPRASADDIEMPPEGYRWLVAHIDPSSPDPYTADVRRQFIEAGGLAMWAELQGLSERVVKAAGEVAKVASDQGIDLISELTNEGFGTNTLLLTEEMVEKMGETLKIDDLFQEGTAIPRSILDSGIDVINELNPLAPKRE